MICRDATWRFWFVVFACMFLSACAPRPVYRASRAAPPRVAPEARGTKPPVSTAETIAPPPEAIEEKQRPVLSESPIQEQAIGRNEPRGPAESDTGSRVATPRGVEPSETAALDSPPPGSGENYPPFNIETAAPEARLESTRGEGAERAVISARPAETSLVAMITPETHPRVALSLRLAENGRTLLQDGEFQKAVAQLEKAISVDSRNRYAYYYLAQAHYALEHYRQSLNFLEITQPYFAEEPAWRAQVLALQGRNYQALGYSERADEYFIRALSFDPENRFALEGITRFDPQVAGSGR